MISRITAMLLVLTGCDATNTQPIQSEENFPTIDLSIGSKRVELPFGVVRCEKTSAKTTVQLSLPSGNEPLVFLSRFTDSDVVDAHVWIPEGTLGHAEELPWVQIVAADVDGADKPECRIETVDGFHTIICNNATLVPWTEPGPVPKPGFKVRFSCP